MAIPVKLEIFEGPLDLLLHLIEKNKIDIYDIPIAMITDQYMAYIQAMKVQDLGVMSEFMVMAATLLDIKCRMLLPPAEETEGDEAGDPRDDLVKMLLEYKMYKYMSYELRDMMMDAGDVFFRSKKLPRQVSAYQEPVEPAQLLAGVTIEKLNSVFRSVIRRQEDRVDPIRSRFGKIEKEPVTVSDKILQLKDYARSHRSFSFRSFLEREKSRTAVIVTFLSMLELIKTGYLSVEQDQLFDDIQIQVLADPDTWKNLTEFADE